MQRKLGKGEIDIAALLCRFVESEKRSIRSSMAKMTNLVMKMADKCDLDENRTLAKKRKDAIIGSRIDN